MYFVYSLMLYMSVPLVLCRLAWLGMRNRDYLKRWPERFGYAAPVPSREPVIWVHAVSVGEVQAAGPLLEYLWKNGYRGKLLLTTTTPGGARTAERLYGNTVEQRYFPYDLPGVVKRFLNTITPRLLIVMETEIWPNLYRECRRRNIDIALVNARLSDKSRHGYNRFRSLTTRTLQCLSLVAAQSRADAERFLSLGVKPECVKITGNLKFDIARPHSITEAAEVRRRFFSPSRPVWIAASTHEGEEAMVLEAFRRVLEQHADCLLVLAPRHPERSDEILELCGRHGFLASLHTYNRQYTERTQIYVIDTLGELPVFYAAADIGFVGGSLVPHGGHNLLEPASLGIPVLAGRHLFNFVEISELLVSAGAMKQVSTVPELAGKVCELLEDANLRHAMGERGRRVVEDNQGTLVRLVESLDHFL